MAAKFRLSLGPHLIELKPGPTILGRGDECTICLDDERISRNHAQIDIKGDVAELNDLGSRNGTMLNGRPVREPTALSNGDVIRIGRHEMTVQVRHPTGDEASQRRGITLHGGKSPAAPTHATLEAFDLASGLTAEADLLRKALQMDRFDEAERLLKARVSRLLSGQTKTLANDPSVQISTEGLLRLAQHSMDAVWLDRLFMLHAQLKWWMEVTVEAQAVRLLRAIGKLAGTGLTEYLDHWTAKQKKLDAGQRRRLQQLRDLADHLAPKEEPH